jgi:hypothetical protein
MCFFQVPKTVMEDREIEVPRQIYETITRTVQRPKTVMEEKTITIQEPKMVQVPREVIHYDDARPQMWIQIEVCPSLAHTPLAKSERGLALGEQVPVQVQQPMMVQQQPVMSYAAPTQQYMPQYGHQYSYGTTPQYSYGGMPTQYTQ